LNDHLQDFYTVKTRKQITDDKAVIQVLVKPSSTDIIVEPDAFTLDIRQQSHFVRVTYIGQKDVQDTDFTIEHKTLSSELEMHRLSIGLKCFKLGQKFKEALDCSG
jgi:hypothetical protein